MSCHGKPDYTNDLSSNTIGGILKRQLCHDNLNINSLPNELSVSLKSRCFFDAVCNVKIKDIPTNAPQSNPCHDFYPATAIEPTTQSSVDYI